MGVSGAWFWESDVIRKKLDTQMLSEGDVARYAAFRSEERGMWYELVQFVKSGTTHYVLRAWGKVNAEGDGPKTLKFKLSRLMPISASSHFDGYKESRVSSEWEMVEEDEAVGFERPRKPEPEPDPYDDPYAYGDEEDGSYVPRKSVAEYGFEDDLSF